MALLYTTTALPYIDLLKPYVKNIWTTESYGLATQAQSISFYADGFPGIMFQQADGDIFLNEQKRKQCEIFLYGQTIRPVQIRTTGKFRMIVFYLHPPVARYLFNILTKELTDTCLDLGDEEYSKTTGLIEKLYEADSLDNQVRIIAEYLFCLVHKKTISPDTTLDYALEQIQSNTGEKALTTIRKDINITERTFERKFEQYVGIPPRLYAKICRFRQSLQQLNTNRYNKLSDLAFDNGFADQSHFIRTFKTFTGLTPKEYLALNTSPA